jgi:hypothetical protein
VIPPELTLDYYQRVLRDSGPHAADSTRLFMIPGMQHCGGGTGFSIFGQVSAPLPGISPRDSVGAAIQAWVENRRVPDSLIGRRNKALDDAALTIAPSLLCAYPARAVPVNAGGGNATSTFECRAPESQLQAAYSPDAPGPTKDKESVGNISSMSPGVISE